MPRVNAAASSPQPQPQQQQEQLQQQIEQLRRKALLVEASTSSVSVDPYHREPSRKRTLPEGDRRWDGSESESDHVHGPHAEDESDDEFASIGGPQAFKFPKLLHPVLTRQRAIVSESEECPSMPLVGRTPALVVGMPEELSPRINAKPVRGIKISYNHEWLRVRFRSPETATEVDTAVTNDAIAALRYGVRENLSFWGRVAIDLLPEIAPGISFPGTVFGCSATRVRSLDNVKVMCFLDARANDEFGKADVVAWLNGISNELLQMNRVQTLGSVKYQEMLHRLGQFVDAKRASPPPVFVMLELSFRDELLENGQPTDFELRELLASIPLMDITRVSTMREAPMDRLQLRFDRIWLTGVRMTASVHLDTVAEMFAELPIDVINLKLDIDDTICVPAIGSLLSTVLQLPTFAPSLGAALLGKLKSLTLEEKDMRSLDRFACVFSALPHTRSIETVRLVGSIESLWFPPFNWWQLSQVKSPLALSRVGKLRLCEAHRLVAAPNEAIPRAAGIICTVSNKILKVLLTCLRNPAVERLTKLSLSTSSEESFSYPTKVLSPDAIEMLDANKCLEEINLMSTHRLSTATMHSIAVPGNGELLSDEEIFRRRLAFVNIFSHDNLVKTTRRAFRQLDIDLMNNSHDLHSRHN
ncbi:hypothetical protein FI667_g9454, partial [Globisporangium splendens]